jgi:acetylornithine deacetylase/succinyl-diaminopimelate desuccinylase-like protein
MSNMRYDKLHNNAFACDVSSPGMQSFQWAYEASGKPWPEPTGWQVSCDARIFAKHGHNVVTFGPGTLKEAHSDTEHLDMRQVQEGLILSVLQAMRLGGAI